MGKIKITIGIPTNRGLRSLMAKSLLDMVAYTEADYHFVLATEGYTTAENRNYIASQALKNNSSWVLMVDDDMVFPKNTLQKLLDTKKEIIGVLSYSRMLPLKPTVIPKDKIKNELFECKEVGGGVLLIDTKVFNKIPQPWFAYLTHPFGMIRVGEDAFFSHRAIENGIKVYCEPSLSIGHLGIYNYGI